MNQQEAIEKLRAELDEGCILYTQLEHVSKSGMTRYIKVRQIKNDYPLNWSYVVAKALGWRISDRYDGIKVSGCGMDMGFHLIYSLSQVLYGDGYALQQRWL